MEEAQVLTAAEQRKVAAAERKAAREAEKASKDAERAAKKAADKEAKDAAKAAAKAAKAAAKAEKAEKKGAGRRGAFAGKFVKVLVAAADSGLRVGSNRFKLLAALGEVDTIYKFDEVNGHNVAAEGEPELKLTSSRFAGMATRGHIAVSDDGVTFTKVGSVEA